MTDNELIQQLFKRGDEESIKRANWMMDILDLKPTWKDHELPDWPVPYHDIPDTHWSFDEYNEWLDAEVREADARFGNRHAPTRAGSDSKAESCAA